MIKVTELVQNFEPFHDFVLIEKIPQDETPGGLALPEGVDPDGAAKARIVAVGPGRVLESGAKVEPSVAVGDIVYSVVAYAQPLPLVLGGKDYFLVRDRDLVAQLTLTTPRPLLRHAGWAGFYDRPLLTIYQGASTDPPAGDR